MARGITKAEILEMLRITTEELERARGELEELKGRTNRNESAIANLTNAFRSLFARKQDLEQQLQRAA